MPAMRAGETSGTDTGLRPALALLALLALQRTTLLAVERLGSDLLDLRLRSQADRGGGGASSGGGDCRGAHAGARLVGHLGEVVAHAGGARRIRQRLFDGDFDVEDQLRELQPDRLHQVLEENVS